VQPRIEARLALIREKNWAEADKIREELLALGIREYRETSFKPYRILYSVAGRHVDVYLIADGRRDMQALLARRLLEG
jgi:hypothetical protein